MPITNPPEPSAAASAAADFKAWSVLVAPPVASMVGAVMSLSVVERLTTQGRIAAVSLGFVTSLTVAPILVAVTSHFLPWLPSFSLSVGISYLVALCSVSAVPELVKTVSALVGKDGIAKRFLNLPEPGPSDPSQGNSL